MLDYVILRAFIKFIEMNALIFHSADYSTVNKVNLWLEKQPKNQNFYRFSIFPAAIKTNKIVQFLQTELKILRTNTEIKKLILISNDFPELPQIRTELKQTLAISDKYIQSLKLA